MNNLQVCVDGSPFANQATGGITRIYSEILKAMCDIDDGLLVKLVCPQYLKQPPPYHSHIKTYKLRQVALPDNLRRFRNVLQTPINSFLFDYQAGQIDGLIWHSTNYRFPEKWKGARVSTVYDLIHEKFPQYYASSRYEKFRQQKKASILSSEIVICISETTQKDIIELYGIDPRRVFVTYLAPQEVFRPVDAFYHFMFDKPFLLYLGRRLPYKNFALLLEAYSRWKEKSEILLVVVGQCWNEQELSLLNEKKVLSHVRLMDKVDDEMLCRLYNQAMAFVYPSQYEGFGIPLVEAMACGCPIIASKIPSTIEIAGDIPIYFDANSIESLLESFNDVLVEGEKSDRAQLGLMWVKKYSWQKTAQGTLQAYRAAVELKGRNAA